jgi:hypothetical protein
LERGDFLNGSLIYSYIEDIAKRIHDPALHGAASVMVGAGFSKNADVVDDEASAPNWEELAVSMFEALYQKPEDEAEIKSWEIQKIKKTSGKNVLKLAEEYKSVFGRNKLNKFIEANINDDRYIPGDLHKKLLSLNWRDVFTTNYDTLLERTIDKINVKFNYKILTSQNDLPGSTHPRIIKLHGSVDSAKHYIICEEDYRTYPVQFAPLVNTVQQAMLETQLCLIGFSGDDPNFLSWLGWLRDNMGENCPTIYLVGLFQNMSAAEKMTLESQNITVVDLGDMFKGEVGHREALDAFLDKLINYGKEKGKIFEPDPYKFKVHSFDFHKTIDDEYFEVMDKYLTRIKEKTNGYLAFPNDHEASGFTESLKHHLSAFLKLEPSKSRISLLSKMVYLLRRGYIILEDFEAMKIQTLLDIIPEEELKTEKALVSSWSEVALYLLEMYRIDGRNEDYEALLTRVENMTLKLDGYTKEELQIEKCKFLISKFDYVEAAKEVEIINHHVALDIQLKKVFLYKQIGEDEKGKALLRQASALLSQKKYSENKTASLRGFLNLCARSLINGLGEKIDDSFTDKEYNLNAYNVRNIYNQIKNEVSNSLLLAHTESRGEIPGFNPGTCKVTYGTTSKIKRNAVSNPLKYIMFQDLLCLPNTFSDHNDILTLALKEILHTSQSPTWKWSAIICTNDSKIINSFFTRERIISAETKWVEEMFDQLSKLSDQFPSTRGFTNQRKIINQKIIFDILSRFSIVVDEEKVIQLIKKITEIRKDLDDFDSSYLNDFFRRLKHSLNSKVFSYYFDVLLESDSIPLGFLLNFIDVEVNIEPPEITDDIYNKVISEIMSGDENTRDRGIAKAVLIKTFTNFGEYEQKTAQALWDQLNKKGFPKCNAFHVWVWEELPHPKDVNFNALYDNYLKNPIFTRSVNGGVIAKSNTTESSVNEYMNLFRRVSAFAKKSDRNLGLSWEPEYFVNIINYIYEYIDNEKSVLNHKMSLFGMGEEGEKRFVMLGDFVAMLTAQARYSNVYTNDVEMAVNNVKKVLTENDISTSTLDLMGKVFSGNLTDEDVKRLMNLVIVGSRDELRQVMNAIDILLMLESNSVNNVNVSNHLVDLISSLKYFDAERSSSVIYQLVIVIEHPLLTKEAYRNTIIYAFRENLDKLDLSLNESDRDLIESLYSLSILVRRYYDSLIRSEISISDKFLSIIEELSQSKLKEVRYMWEDIQPK